MDAGVWSRKVTAARIDHDTEFSIALARQEVITTAVDASAEDAWSEIPYTNGGATQVAEATGDRCRLSVRHTRIDDAPNLPTCTSNSRSVTSSTAPG